MATNRLRLQYYEAKELAARHNIPLHEDFHSLPSDIVANIVRAGKERGYVKWSKANGSYARCFYEYLNRATTKRPIMPR